VAGIPAGGGNAPVAALRALAPGGLVLFAQDVPSIDAAQERVSHIRRQLECDAGLPLSICVDQEGGRVARVPRDVPMPSMLTLGASADVGLAEQVGAALAADVRAVGGNVDFAPVLDLALSPESTVVGTRSLGTDPALVARLGAALVRGLQAGGVAAVVKHFPGHGATSQDSHVAMPVVETGAAVLDARELVPFRAAFAAGARGVMSAHVRFTALDGAHPATMSQNIVGALLRDALHFDGVCFTDCLEMAGTGAEGTVAGGVAALRAGADALVVSHSIEWATELRDAIVLAVTSGSVPLDRLRAASRRVDALRASHARRADVAPVDGALVAREVARRAIVVVRGDAALRLDRPVTVVSFEGSASDGVADGAEERPSLNLALRRRRVRSELLRVAPAPDESMRAMLVDVLEGRDAELVILARRAHLHGAQREAIDALVAAYPAALVVSMLEPFDVPAFVRARNVACTFGDESTNVEALADVLTGAHAARGHMPVAVAPA